MTLSRRDEFAARALSALLSNSEVDVTNIEDACIGSVGYADALVAHLDRTSPTSLPVVEDDGREIRGIGSDVLITVREDSDGDVEVDFSIDSFFLKVKAARLFFLRGLRICDAIEGKQ